MNPYVDFPRAIAFIHRRWRARLEERLRDTGLTQARLYVLLTLSKADGGLLQRELAERVGIEASTLVKQLDDLQRDGLIVRTPMEGDRRANLIRLTNTAHPLIVQITKVADELRDEVLGGVSKADLAAALPVLVRISERLE